MERKNEFLNLGTGFRAYSACEGRRVLRGFVKVFRPKVISVQIV
jgi:hypothetical protein